FVMPSRSESFGIAAIEALATGTPVIAASTGGLRENILDGSNGFLFSVESVGELVKAIEKAASYNWDRKNISKQTYNKFSRERWQHNFLRIVKEIS
ncbi:MAG: glycosyltransferase, partial [Chlorobiota bacterium]